MDNFDVIVLGTGAAGLTAAIAAHDAGARVVVYEKGDKIGGTSAWSGGQVWIPNNPHMKALGKQDCREDAIAYIMSMSNGVIDEEIAMALVDSGPEVVSFLEAQTPVKFKCVADFPDYHPEQPGGKSAGGRTLECPPYPFGELGSWADKVNVGDFWPDVHISVGETTLCQAKPIEIPELEKQRRIAADERGLGLSLIARLLRGCLDRGIEPVIGARGVDLLLEDGGIAGVKLEQGGKERSVRAGSVILATGGFEWDEELCKAFLRGPLQGTFAVPTNTGDGLKMAMAAGCMLGNMKEAWWMPMIEVPKQFYAGEKILFSVERGLPGSIMVNQSGKRFTNESANYNAFGAAFHEVEVNSCTYRNLPCWVVFDQAFYDRYGFASYYGALQSDEWPPSWVMQGSTLAHLADKLGIDSDALNETVSRWNDYVGQGFDPEFHRGESYFDRWWGDITYRGTKAAALGPVTQGPYYAVEVKSGALGTKGGPKTDADAQVLNMNGRPISGLYAVGNTMASPMGMTYGGGGGTLGPGLVFGYRAGRHAGRRAPK